MARVTVEDCVEKVPNRFELVMLAAQRARRIGSGASLTVERDNDKNPVVALREIAETTVQPDDLREELVRNHQRFVQSSEEEPEEIIDLTESSQEEWASLSDRDEDEEDDEEDFEEEDAEPTLDDIAGGGEKAP